MHPQHHNISHVASRAMDRWRYLAFEGLSWSRVRRRPDNLDTVEHFTAAYRRSATELARVRAFSPDKRLAEYIEQAVATAHFAVYRRNRVKLKRVLEGAIFGVPRAVRSMWAYHLLSLLIVGGSTLVAFLSVIWAPETYYLFVDRELAGGRDPSASRETLASTLGAQETTPDVDALFSTFLFTHNTKVAFMCFAWGICLGLPTIYLLIRTGLMLGAFTALFVMNGLTVEFGAWILPHGVPEIGAIILAGGAGMAMGRRLLNPGGKSRKEAMTDTAGRACIVALGCVPLLFMAGIIEGVFRQSHASTGARYALAAVVFVICAGWLLAVTKRRQGNMVAAARPVA